MGLESKINSWLNNYPNIKKKVKRVYQKLRCGFAPKVTACGNITRVSPMDSEYEYFFGYYDKSPWDISNRYILCLQARCTWKETAPREKANIVLIDTARNNHITLLGETNTWNVQQGCMLQWLGGNDTNKIIYNDYRDEKYCSVIVQLKMSDNDVEKISERVIPFPVYSVSLDGRFALSLDFSRLHRLRPGYGYSNIADATCEEKLPDSTCIWKIDLNNGEIFPLLKYTDFSNFEPRKEMDNAEHKVNHIMISPNGKRFMVLHRWLLDGKKYTRLITCNVDGTGMYNLSDDDMVSHCCWKNEQEILAFAHKNDGGNGYYLMKDCTKEYVRYWKHIDFDGHPSFSPNGKYVVFDRYPNGKRLYSIMTAAADGTSEIKTLATVFAPFRYDNDTRCDLHPRWNRTNDVICFDAAFEGKRGLYMVPTEKKRIRVGYILTACKRKGPVQQMYNLMKYIDKEKFEPILITIYEEPKDGTSQVDKFMALGIEHVFCKLTKMDIMCGNTKSLYMLIKKYNIDIVHATGVFPDYAVSRMKDVKQVLTSRNYVWEDYISKFGKVKGTILARMHLSAMKHADVAVACSESLAKMYQKINISLQTVRNGVDLEKYGRVDSSSEKRRLRIALHLPLDKIIYVYSGQVRELKNQSFLLETLIDEMQNNKQIYILLLGDGADFRTLSSQYAKYNNIDFRGEVANVSEFLQASDVYVSTSKSEGMPGGVLEAMASGLPVILSDIVQHKEIFAVNNEIGFLYRQNDKADLAQKMMQLMNTEKIERMGNIAYQVAHSEFSAQKTCREYEQIYLNM